ncbi:unnamed protein product [Boreogadus saida]
MEANLEKEYSSMSSSSSSSRSSGEGVVGVGPTDRPRGPPRYLLSGSLPRARDRRDETAMDGPVKRRTLSRPDCAAADGDRVDNQCKSTIISGPG